MTEADGNQLLGRIRGIIQAGLDALRPEVAGDNVTVLHGWPVTIVAAEPTTEDKQRTRVRGQRPPLYFNGRTLVFEDAQNGDYGTFELGVGSGFRDGKARLQGAKLSRGGVLVWEHRYNGVIEGFAQVDLTWERVVTLRSLPDVPPNVPVRVAVQDYDTPVLQLRQGAGVVYQLCAQYTPAGVITFYSRLPEFGSNRDLYWEVEA